MRHYTLVAAAIMRNLGAMAAKMRRPPRINRGFLLTLRAELAFLRLLLGFKGLLLLVLPLPAQASELLISAAISLKPALEQIDTLYKGQPTSISPSVKLRFNFASTGALQKQIEAGAPVDIFLAAGQEAMDTLKQEMLPEGSALWLRNRLVLAIPREEPDLAHIRELEQPRFKRLAMGDPKTVPAGLYAADTLQKAELSEKLAAKIVLTHHVRQVLSYLERGDVQAGFVYASDLRHAPGLKVGFAVPEAWHRPIVYPAAVLKSSRQRQAALDFLAFLQSKAARQIWRQEGFLLDDQTSH